MSLSLSFLPLSLLLSILESERHNEESFSMQLLCMAGERLCWLLRCLVSHCGSQAIGDRQLVQYERRVRFNLNRLWILPKRTDSMANDVSPLVFDVRVFFTPRVFFHTTHDTTGKDA
jgi:hypothetical protein